MITSWRRKHKREMRERKREIDNAFQKEKNGINGWVITNYSI